MNADPVPGTISFPAEYRASGTPSAFPDGTTMLMTSLHSGPSGVMGGFSLRQGQAQGRGELDAIFLARTARILETERVTTVSGMAKTSITALKAGSMA